MEEVGFLSEVQRKGIPVTWSKNREGAAAQRSSPITWNSQKPRVSRAQGSGGDIGDQRLLNELRAKTLDSFEGQAEGLKQDPLPDRQPMDAVQQ